MEGGLLSLRWNDHSHTFFDMLSTIRRKESYCDVTLVSDGRFYPVHKLVLSTCSDFFDNLFSRTDCKHPVVIVANVSHKDLEALLNYMYLGEVNVLQTELGNLMKAAEVLKIKGLAEPTKSTTKDKDRHHKSFSESFDSSTKRKRVEDSSGPSSKRSQCTGKPDSTESARSRVSSDLQTLSKDSDHGAILPIPSSSNTDPKECLTRTVYDQKGSREDDSSEKAIRPEVKVEEIMVKDEPGSWFNENDESGTNVSYSETDSNIEYSNQTVDYSNSCVPWELPTAAQPHLMESHLPQGMPGASGMQAMLQFIPRTSFQQLERHRIYDATKRTRKFVEGWKDEFPWVIYHEEQKVMTCTTCRKYCREDDKSHFISGNANFKKLALIRHNKSLLHRRCEAKKAARMAALQLPNSADNVARLQLELRESHE
ncbi:zinc finger and BTB domain-containing protein 17-like isoform X1 [Macrobrachium nipponense]|uniref:zinc finger and BTB domain-containing protein 17-like isoform X1 n=2 Tax=Macrobrachium nipponense TaxID=159736 RepID=UPI0030C8C5F0